MLKSIGQKPLVANGVLKNVYRTLEAALDHVEYELPESPGHLFATASQAHHLRPILTKRECVIEKSRCHSTEDTAG